jgi:ATP-binding cassette subfamily A (ABC1) protein 3
MISYITREKELRQKELMKMMGVSEADIGWSWFWTFFVLHILTASAATGVSVTLYTSSNALLMWIFWMLTFLSFVVFSMLVASLTSKATRGVIVGLLIFFVGVFLPIAQDPQSGSKGAITAISLHPVAAFSYGLSVIGTLEDDGVGLQYSTISGSDSPSGYSFNNCLASLIIDSILWGLVTFYLNRVIRPDYGQALPLWFVFSPTYWCPGSARAGKHEDGNDANNSDERGIPNEPVGQALLRQKVEGQNIEVYNLRKVFGEKAAVDGLTLSMYSGQITALLGHNGAGKTTTINCLTGALSPTSGYATIAGMDTRTQMQKIRQNIGICLQHDCLFPNLTVREHVQFFSRLKGLYEEMSWKDAEAHVDEALQDVALSEKRNTRSKNLSGGMKRKLSVAIAFCGGSKVVLLDEPTSGMVRRE